MICYVHEGGTPAIFLNAPDLKIQKSTGFPKHAAINVAVECLENDGKLEKSPFSTKLLLLLQSAGTKC